MIYYSEGYPWVLNHQQISKSLRKFTFLQPEVWRSPPILNYHPFGCFTMKCAHGNTKWIEWNVGWFWKDSPFFSKHHWKKHYIHGITMYMYILLPEPSLTKPGSSNNPRCIFSWPTSDKATWHATLGARSGFSVRLWCLTCSWPKRRTLCWTMMKDHWPSLIQPCLRSFLRRWFQSNTETILVK